MAANSVAEFALNPPLPINAGEFIGVFFATGRVGRDAAGPAGFFATGDQSAAVEVAFGPTGQAQVGGDIAP